MTFSIMNPNHLISVFGICLDETEQGILLAHIVIEYLFDTCKSHSMEIYWIDSFLNDGPSVPNHATIAAITTPSITLGLPPSIRLMQIIQTKSKGLFWKSKNIRGA